MGTINTKFNIGDRVQTRFGSQGTVTKIIYSGDDMEVNYKVEHRFGPVIHDESDLSIMQDFLTSHEKCYLGNFIYPFKDRVTGIRKVNTASFLDLDAQKLGKRRIEIYLTNPFEICNLPSFPNSQFAGLEDNEEYTVEELNIFEERREEPKRKEFKF